MNIKLFGLLLVGLVLSGFDEVQAQSNREMSRQCIERIEPQVGRYPLGAIRNTCDIALNLVYCITDHNLIYSQEDCANDAFKKQRSIGARQTMDADVRAEVLLVHACRAPRKPQEPRMMGSHSLEATCGTDDEWTAAGKKPSNSRSSQTENDSSSSQTANDSRSSKRANVKQPRHPWAPLRLASGCSILTHGGKPYLNEEEYSLSWSGACVDGLAHGPGTMTVKHLGEKQRGDETQSDVPMYRGVSNGTGVNWHCSMAGTPSSLQCPTRGKWMSVFEMGCMISSTSEDFVDMRPEANAATCIRAY